MLLTLDVGNTNTVLGVFRGQQLIANWRLSTARDQTIDEYGILTRDLFTLAKLEPQEIGGVIISSVVPPLNSTLAGMAERYFNHKALFVEPGVKTGMVSIIRTWSAHGCAATPTAASTARTTFCLAGSRTTGTVIQYTRAAPC